MSDFIINNSETNDKNDWRYMGQDKYLMKVMLIRCNFRESLLEHDHCAFCFAKFGNTDGSLSIGYCTQDKYHWICDNCFNDFLKMFEWTVAE